MIPHTCITNGVFSFTLGQEGWGFHYVSRTEEEKCQIGLDAFLKESKANLVQNQKPLFHTRARATENVWLSTSLMANMFRSGD
jgi:hypothetical protein